MNFQSLNPFRKVGADEMAVVELEDARRQLLESQTAKEYYMALEAYNMKRIERLTKRLKEQS